MKILVNLARIIVGVLFIFSGLVKANDPLGLAYKMQEFFDAWGWPNWENYTLALSVTMIGFEIVAGVALLLGWQMRLFSWLLLLLMVFFLFLTSYVLFSGKIKACGCFGDCIPLTPIQTFTKDVILLLLIIFLLRKGGYIEPILKSPIPFAIVLVSIIATCLLQMHVVEHLPLVDCL